MKYIKTEYLPHYTYKDYKIWKDRWEIINGIAFSMHNIRTIKHQQISNNINYQLVKQLQQHKSNCHALLPVDWKISEDTVVQPDNLVVCYKPTGAYITKAPSLIFEVLSKSTAKKDKTLKFEIFQKKGVKYYIIVDPDDKIAKAYKLKDGRYIKMLDATDENVEFELKNCNITIDFDKLWR